MNTELLSRHFAEACYETLTEADVLQEVAEKSPEDWKKFISHYLSLPLPAEDISASIDLEKIVTGAFPEEQKLIWTNILAARTIVRKFVSLLLKDLDFEEIFFLIRCKANEQAYLAKEGISKKEETKDDDQIRALLRDLYERILKNED